MHIAHVELDTESQVCSSPDDLKEIPAKLTPDNTNATASTVDIFPDSGANICLAGPKQLEKLGLDVSQLRPSSKRVRTVGGAFLVCKGWAPVKFEIGRHKTVQPVYFCDLVDRLYFSKQGCIKMIILHPSYPMPMDTIISAVSSLKSNPQSVFTGVMVL